jgi:hypothetical protein
MEPEIMTTLSTIASIAGPIAETGALSVPAAFKAAMPALIIIALTTAS